eukprot:jgi/Sobl393_1/17314/SZX72189.1
MSFSDGLKVVKARGAAMAAAAAAAVPPGGRSHGMPLYVRHVTHPLSRLPLLLLQVVKARGAAMAAAAAVPPGGRSHGMPPCIGTCHDFHVLPRR